MYIKSIIKNSINACIKHKQTYRSMLTAFQQTSAKGVILFIYKIMNVKCKFKFLERKCLPEPRYALARRVGINLF